MPRTIRANEQLGATMESATFNKLEGEVHDYRNGWYRFGKERFPLHGAESTHKLTHSAPTRLLFRNKRFEPADGFEALFA